MKCPYCGKEMVSGFVQSARKVYFTKNSDSLFMIPMGEDVVLTKHNLIGPVVTAHHCPDCKKVIVDYSADKI